MANNKTGKDASAVTFTYKTTDNAGVDTPHVNVDSAVVSSIAAGENHIGKVGGHLVVIRPTLTVTAGAYSAGDVVSARQTLTNAMRVSSGTGILQDIVVTCADGETWQGSVVLFDSATASALADNAAFAWGSGDHAKLLAHIPFAAAEWTTWGGDTVLHLRNLSIGVAANGSQNLYAYLICTATPTFSATTDVEIAYKFIQN